MAKKARPKTFKCAVYNIHIKGLKKNKGYRVLFDRFKNDISKGKPLVNENEKGVVLRIMNSKEDRLKGYTSVRLLKYNSRATGLAYDLEKEELLENVKQVTAQTVTGFFIHEMHTFVMIPAPHGPSDSEVEWFLEELFKVKIKRKEDFIVESNVFRQSGSTKLLSSWDTIKKVSVEVQRSNPVNKDVGNKLLELTELLGSDKLIMTFVSKTSEGVNEDGARPIINGADKLVSLGQARITAEGIENGKKIFLDSKEAKARKIYIKHSPDDEKGLVEQIIGSVRELFEK